ncbi:MAG: FeoA family protein [Acidobacteriota bacterium]
MSGTAPCNLDGAAIHECPLCGMDFTGAECHSSCPMSRGCAMVRCPRCNYEFVESGRLVDMLRRWIRRAPAIVPQTGDLVPLTALPIGAVASITHLTTTSAARTSRLASYGISPGTEIRLLARRPTLVVACGPSSIAVDDEVGKEIFVRVG